MLWVVHGGEIKSTVYYIFTFVLMANESEHVYLVKKITQHGLIQELLALYLASESLTHHRRILHHKSTQ